MTKPNWGALVDALRVALEDKREDCARAEQIVGDLRQQLALAKLAPTRTAVSTAVVTLRDDLHITDREGRVLVMLHGDGRVGLDPTIAADTIAAEFWRQIGAYRQRPNP